jgi:hypothetical protein
MPHETCKWALNKLRGTQKRCKASPWVSFRSKRGFDHAPDLWVLIGNGWRRSRHVLMRCNPCRVRACPQGLGGEKPHCNHLDSLVGGQFAKPTSNRCTWPVGELVAVWWGCSGPWVRWGHGRRGPGCPGLKGLADSPKSKKKKRKKKSLADTSAPITSPPPILSRKQTHALSTMPHKHTRRERDPSTSVSPFTRLCNS